MMNSMRGALMAVLSAVLLTPGVASAQGQEEILLGVEDQLTVKIWVAQDPRIEIADEEETTQSPLEYVA